VSDNIASVAVVSIASDNVVSDNSNRCWHTPFGILAYVHTPFGFFV
jgi:hypothetical protein